tara:strand:- start:44 stop:445 length:402 start_codon:yes stop_codon:yes gene_type:complete
MSVYKISHPDYPNDCYIGSTKGKLSSRLWTHKNHSKYPDKYKSKLYDIMRETDKKLFNIKLLESCDLNLIKQKEQEFIDNITPTWNTIRAFRTEEQHKDYERLRQQTDKVKNYKKEWYIKNRDRILKELKEKE